MPHDEALPADAGPTRDPSQEVARVTVVPLHGGPKQVPYDPRLERQLAVARRVLVEQADVLRALAEYDRT